MYDMNVMPYPADDERNTLIDDDGVLHSATADTHYVHGDTPAFRRTGVSDRQAAGWVDMPSVHADAFDADDYNRPVNGLGTYHETDGAW